MRQSIITFLPLALLLALFGCTQGGVPSACAGAPSGTLANCIYVSAVLDQNPYNCYSLSNLSQREKCLNDASDSTAQKLLQRMSSSERAQIFAPAQQSTSSAGSQIAPLPPVPAETNATAGNVTEQANSSNGISAADSHAYSQAIATNDMTPCVSIADPSTRASCITQVAIRVKNPAMCAQFTLKADIDLCNLYAKAGEQAK